MGNFDRKSPINMSESGIIDLILPEIDKVKKHWWKILGALLVGYSVIVGLTAKVGPGVADSIPSTISSGQTNDIKIIGYNTDFTKAENIVRLKRGKFILQANKTEVISKNEMLVNIPVSADIPDSIYGKRLMVLVESAYDGLYGMPNLVAIDTVRGDQVFASDTTGVQHKSAEYYSFPFRYLLHETIRNLNFHVPMWFAMITLMLLSFLRSLKQLRTNEMEHDHWANSMAAVGVMLGVAGIITGAVWARFTWGQFWTNDPKLNGAAIGVMMYSAYLVLRSSIEEPQQRAKVSAVYNVFAFPIFVVLILIYPKLAGHSQHPGSGGSVGFDSYDLDNHLRTVFYPAVLGWILIGLWIAQIKGRIEKIKWKIED